MSDPSIEAAQRAWRVQTGSEPLADDNYTIRVRTIAAREALRPIRDIHQKWAEAYAYRADGLVLNAFLAALAPLIFTTEELNQ